MASDVKTTAPARPAHTAPPAARPPVQAQIPHALDAQAASVRTRRGQTLSLVVNGEEEVFFVRSGALMLRATFPGGLRQVVALLFPGDVFRAASVPPHANIQLLAATAGEVLRLHWSTFANLAENDPALARHFDDAVAKQTAHYAIHMAALGRFDCRQRVATYLVDLALRTGSQLPSGNIVPSGSIGFEMPLNRTDMADYLGLNADTLSRTMSRLRALGLIDHPERHRVVVRDLAALAALTPAARALMALSGGTAEAAEGP